MTATGLQKLGFSSGSRDGYLFIPDTYRPDKAAPLIVTLHANGKGGLDGLGFLYEPAKAAGAFVVVDLCSYCRLPCASARPQAVHLPSKAGVQAGLEVLQC